MVNALVDWLVPPCLRFVQKQVKVKKYLIYNQNADFNYTLQELVATSNSNLVRSLMYLFEMLMKDICEDEAAIKDKNMKIWITSVFIFSLIWSIGATGDKTGHEKFDTFLRDLMGDKNEEHPIPTVVGKVDCPVPPEGSIYDYLFEVSIIRPK